MLELQCMGTHTSAEEQAEIYLPHCSQDSQDHFHMSYAEPESPLRIEPYSVPMDPSLSKTHEGGTTNAHCSTCEKRQTRQRICLVPRQHLFQVAHLIIQIDVFTRKYFI